MKSILRGDTDVFVSRLRNLIHIEPLHRYLKMASREAGSGGADETRTQDNRPSFGKDLDIRAFRKVLAR